MAWPDASDVENYLRPASTLDADSVELGLDLVTAAIRNYTAQHLDLVANDSVQVLGPVGRHLFLPEAPVVSVASVTLNASGASPTVYEATDWVLDSEQAALIRVGGVWTTSPSDVITVVYTHGYADIPDDIRGAALSMFGRWYDNRGGVSSERIGEYAATYFGESFLPEERTTLDRYRLVTVR